MDSEKILVLALSIIILVLLGYVILEHWYRNYIKKPEIIEVSLSEEIPYKYVDASIYSLILKKGKTYRFSGGFTGFKIIENSDSCSIIVPTEDIRIEQIGVVAEYIPEKGEEWLEPLESTHSK